MRLLWLSALVSGVFSCGDFVDYKRKESKRKIDEMTRMVKENSFSVSREDYEKLMQLSNDTTLSEGERKLQIRKQSLLIQQKGMQGKHHSQSHRSVNY